MGYAPIRQLVAVANRTATGNSGTINLFDDAGTTAPQGVRFFLDVTDFTSGTFDISVDGVLPNGDVVPMGSFAQVSGTGAESIFVQGVPNAIQVTWVGAATPDATFGVWAQLS